MLTEGFSVPRLAWFLKPLLLLPDLFLEAPPLWVLVLMSPAQVGSQGGVGGSGPGHLLLSPGGAWWVWADGWVFRRLLFPRPAYQGTPPGWEHRAGDVTSSLGAHRLQTMLW